VNEGTCGSPIDGMGMFAFTGKDHYMVRSYRLKGMDREAPIYKLSPVEPALSLSNGDG
jgi:hypothetical protein